VEIDGVAVQEGQVIGLHNGSLKVAGDTVPDTVMRLLAAMGASEHEIITLFYGEPISEAQAKQMADAIRAAYADQSVEVHRGGQPHYHYILSAE
jgi:hypothetical protein